jgi:hypothetical protein
MWHYPMCHHYSMCWHVFLSWYYLQYTSWSLNIHISLIESPILEIFSAMNSVLHFFHIYNLDFYLKIKILPSNFEKILWSNKFLKVLVKIIFYENQDGIFFSWDLRLWILTIQPSHFYSLAYFRPIHVISIEFQSIDSD